MASVTERIWLALAGLSGMAAVGGDAAARHVLAGDPYRLDLVATGARYGLAHALALLGLAALAAMGRPAPAGPARLWLAVSGWCFAAGLVLFPGSLYLLAAGAPPLVARATPAGGIAFIAGWAALLLAALSPRPAR
jgi:uncharacterized membrane protein YgdD (TMEM256/DUF423 family)